MFSYPVELLPHNQRKQLSAEEMAIKRARLLAQRLQKEGNETNHSNNQPNTELITLIDTNHPSTDMTNLKQPEIIVEQKDTELIGFARLYSGTIKVGQTIQVLGPKYDPKYPDKFRGECKITHLYQLMGRDLEEVDSVTCGNIFGIAGIEGHLLKCGTLSNLIECPSLAVTNSEVSPIVRVAVEPQDPTKMPQLLEGLKLL